MVDRPGSDAGSVPIPDRAVAAWLTNRSRCITAWTDEAEKLTGYTTAQAVGLPARALYTADDQRNSVPELELVAAIGGVRVFQGIRVRRDASRFTVWSRLLPLQFAEGSPAGFVELMIPEPPPRNGFAIADPRRRLDGVVNAVRHELYALRLATSDPEMMARTPVRQRIVELIDELHSALEELGARTTPSEERGKRVK